jgi:hypothetical protein
MRFVLTVLAGAFSLTLLAHAARADNDTACGAVLCLSGEARGQGGGASCANYLNPYFSISVFKGDAFKATDTIPEGGNFLDDCSSSCCSKRSYVNNEFGHLEFLP